MYSSDSAAYDLACECSRPGKNLMVQCHRAISYVGAAARNLVKE